jgi:hypothetical protein
MEKLIVDNCPACDPINRLVKDLVERGYMIIERKLEDYHFHQLYFKVDTRLSEVKDINTSGLTRFDNFLVCDCHWSRIEFINE